MSKILSNSIAAVLLIIMVGLAFLSLAQISLTTDESPHITAGYSYLTQRDMRLNPEHPPLLKDLAAIPLLFQDINFPSDHPAWQEDINGQWVLGHAFFFESGNNPDNIMLASRVAMLVILVLLGIYIFKWARERFGGLAGILALTIFVFSPTFLAHGRLVTTDVGAAFGFIFALYYFLKFISYPSRKHLIFAGLAFGVAQLLKFSLVLLIPVYLVIIGVFWLATMERDWSGTKPGLRLRRFGIRLFKYVRALVLIIAIGFLLIWPVYQFHVLDYPAERQVRDTAQILESNPYGFAADAVVWMADKPILRPYAQYILGLLMVFQRTAGGNTTYFLGDVSSDAWKSYFPVVFGLKVPVPLLLLVIVALAVSLSRVLGAGWNLRKTSAWIANHITEFSWIFFILFYWLTSIAGNLNIGLRHVLPTFPFIYLLITWQITQWRLNARFGGEALRSIVVAIIVLWYAAVSLLAFPHYISFFNVLAGGWQRGHEYVVDSNLDWGQDLGGLVKFVEENNIEKIKVDYFGGDDPKYRLGEKYERFDPFTSEKSGWIAVSATLLQNGRGQATKGFDQSTTHYKWLNEHEPAARAGHSIFIYHIE